MIDQITINATLADWVSQGVTSNQIAAGALAAEVAATQAAILAAMPPPPAGFDATYIPKLVAAIDELVNVPGTLNPSDAIAATIRAILSGDPTQTWNTCFISLAAMVAVSGRWIRQTVPQA